MYIWGTYHVSVLFIKYNELSSSLFMINIYLAQIRFTWNSTFYPHVFLFTLYYGFRFQKSDVDLKNTNDCHSNVNNNLLSNIS